MTKRKRDVIEDGENAAAIKELTGPKRRNKLLSQNPDLEKAQTAAALDNMEKAAPVERSKKRKVEAVDEKQAKKRVQIVDSPAVVEVVYDDSAPQEVDGETHEATEAPPPTTDLDWLRSRTSRTLGLVSDSEGSDHEISPSKDEISSLSDDEPERLEPNNNPVTPPATDPSDIEQPPKSSTAESKILQTGRLFVRNLVYGVTENDLLAIFRPYGEIEEVSNPRHTSLNMMNKPPLDRDN
jgi:multiple RNA-binding domain-containing protein 1